MNARRLMRGLACMPSLVAVGAGAAPSRVALSGPGHQDTRAERDGQRDFDFEIGTWATHVSRRVSPLTGSKTWVTYDGTSVVRKVWDGGANQVELQVSGPAGRIEGLSLRLYNPQTRQWSIYFANSADGLLGPPVTGVFKGGRGEFYGQEVLDGRPIIVRFVISDITPTSCRFEQAFSNDGGTTWETNWIAVDRRTETSDR